MERIHVRTPSAQCIEDVTNEVNDAVGRSGVDEGVCHLFVPHTTAGVVINENADPDVGRDLLEKLESLVPTDGTPGGKYHHYEGNGHAHIKSSLVGQSATVPVVEGRLALGRWQAVFFTEFDGPRERELLVTVVAVRAAAAEAAQEATRADA